jgi:serine/threonine protein kinase
MKGDLKCAKHRSFNNQLATIRRQYGSTEDDLKQLFKDLVPVAENAAHSAATASGDKQPAGETKTAQVSDGNVSAGSTATTAVTATTAAVATTTTAKPQNGNKNTHGKSVQSASTPNSNVLASSASQWGAPGGGVPLALQSTTSAGKVASSSTQDHEAKLEDDIKQEGKPAHTKSPLSSPNQVVPSPPTSPQGVLLHDAKQTGDGTHQKALVPSLNAGIDDLSSLVFSSSLLGSNNKIADGGLSVGNFSVTGSPRLDHNPVMPADIGVSAALTEILSPRTTFLGQQPDPHGNSSKLLSGIYSHSSFPFTGADSLFGSGQSSVFGSASLVGAPVVGAPLGGGAQGSILSVEITECDEIGSFPILRFSQLSLSKDTPSHQIAHLKGVLISSRGNEEVCVTAWSKALPNAESFHLKNEIRVLRLMAKTCIHIGKILNQAVVDVGSGQAALGGDLGCIITEHSDVGFLDNFMQTYALSHPEGLSSLDMQIMCSHLFDAVICCHQHRICHRDIKPSNIVVSRGSHYQTRQFGAGFVLKLTDFRLNSLASGYADPKGIELDKFNAPEIDAAMKNTGVGYQPHSDLWSLGLVVYFISTGGYCPVESHQQAVESVKAGDQEVRKLLERHFLHERFPMIHDLVERLVRSAEKRVNMPLLRCHPFMWSTYCKKKLLIEFANASTVLVMESVEHFMAEMDRYCPLYVYGKDGWVVQMNPSLVAFVQPPSLKAEFWLSGRHFLQAIKNQLLFPEAMHASLFSRLSVGQAVGAYIKQITEHDFPRLLILIYELGGAHGRWEWDGDDVQHFWK